MSNQLTKITPQQLDVPEYLKTAAGNQGFEHMTKDALTIPELRICQSSSSERKELDPRFIEGLKEGELFNTTTKEIYGATVQVTPLWFSQSRIYYRPPSSEAGERILCQSRNAKDGGTLAAYCQDCPHSKFTNNGKPDCTLFFNYPVLLWPQPQLLLFRLKSSALKAAKNWNTLMNLKRPQPMFSGVYEITVVSQSGRKGTYFVPAMKFTRWVNERELHYASSSFRAMLGKLITEEPEPPSTEEPEPPETPEMGYESLDDSASW
jgi:hypothetical protein